MIGKTLLDRIRGDLNLWETPMFWMYLDSEGLVTVGCGTMLPNTASAKIIPFFHSASLQPASQSEIETAWLALHIGAAKQKAALPIKKLSAQHFKNVADLRITKTTSNLLRDAHIDADYKELKKIYIKFDNFPDDAKVALFDMIYNLGPGHGRTRHHRASGLRRYGLMNAAIGEGKWALAADRCSRHGIPPERNRMTSSLFRQCATVHSKAAGFAHAPH